MFVMVKEHRVGAPMSGDGIRWGIRAQQGMDVLIDYIVSGYNRGLMTSRGDFGNCCYLPEKYLNQHTKLTNWTN